MQPISLPSNIKLVHEEGNHFTLQVDPLYPGYGNTLGVALRRVLLSSIPGAAVVAFKIRGTDHEFSTVPNVREDVIEIMLNLKQLRLKVFSEEPVTIFIKKKGAGPVTAADIEGNDQVEVVNTDLHIATIDGDKGELDMEITVQQGRGYVPVEQREGERSEIGLIQVDAVYSPVKKVGYKVENVRVGQMTNYDKLTLDIDTDGTITGKEALDLSTRILIDHLTTVLENITPPELAEESRFAAQTAPAEEVEEMQEEEPMPEPEIEEEEDNLDELELSSRSVNALRKNGIRRIEELQKYSTEELSKLEGLGEKSVEEIEQVLKARA